MFEEEEDEDGASYEDGTGGVYPEAEASVGGKEDVVGGAVFVLVVVELFSEDALG